MSAQCWGCVFGIEQVPPSTTGLPRDAIGTCWECHVFGCPGHAERDRDTGKFMCFPSVAKALGVGAGLESENEIATLAIRSGELERRFPRLAQATERQRHDWRTGDGEGKLGTALMELQIEKVDFFLAAEALAILEFLAPPAAHGRGLWMTEFAEESPLQAIAPGPLGLLAARAIR